MTTSVDVLSYLSSTYPTRGRTQRQKLIYYSQSWHLAWYGSPLFSDPIEAFENGPVARRAWRADLIWEKDPSLMAMPKIAGMEAAVIDAVWAFYGPMTGTQLSALSHREAPWMDNYLNAELANRGRQEIPMRDMREFFTLKAASGEPTPVQPTLAPAVVSDDYLDQVLAVEAPRWAEAMAILATR